MDINTTLENYNLKNLTVAVLGSHSALDVCAGAKKLGLTTLVVAEKGREQTYTKYYLTEGDRGCVDDYIVVDNFKDILSADVQTELLKQNAIFVPNRSFEVYVDDYDAIEEQFTVPMFGNRTLLKVEERGVKPNQYDLLQEAGIRFPRVFENPKDIDRLCIVKVLEKERSFERAFFVVSSYKEYEAESAQLIKENVITKDALEHAVIEEFIVGSHVNFNFFYSPLTDKLELMGTDTRRQTNLEGILRLPGEIQNQILTNHKVQIKYEEAGHIAVTVLESMLEAAFALGEKFVQATRKLYPPGIIGPFALQSIIIPGPPKKDIVVVDVSPRMPGSPGLFATPYSGYLHGETLSVGERVAMEISGAAKNKQLDKIIT